MTNIELLNQILSKYRFVQVVPPDVRRNLLKSKKKTLIAVLKRYGRYSLFMSVVVAVYFYAKKAGLVITLTKSAVAVVTASAVLVIGLLTGGVYIGKYIIQGDNKTERLNIDIQKENERSAMKEQVLSDDKSSGAEKKSAELIIYKLGIIPFEIDEGSRTSADVNKIILDQIVKVRGENYVILMKNRRMNPQPENIVMGSVIKLGDTYRISAKVIESSTSRIKSYLSENASSESDIERASSEIAKKINLQLQ